MRKRFLSLLLLPLLLVGCGSKDNYAYQNQQIDIARSVGEIDSFNLLTPENGFHTDTGFTFTWEVAKNADYYQLEIANTEEFVNDPDFVYVKENNLSTNKFDLTYSLKAKDINYYWRVTALNKDHKKLSNTVGVFYYAAPKVGEIPIEIEDEQDWELHKEGSYANISIDRNNFFGNNENSLVIKFDKEHTCQGIAKSDGWIVITKSEDRELYGTDSFYFNFFYAGHDATILVRVLDEDGEYWHKKVQVSNNVKQTVILKYEDFELRTAGTNIFNKVFDWQHIRYFEIVFERTFGDGVCLFSNIKAVHYDDYSYMFMQKMNFKRDDIDSWKSEYLTFEKTVSEDGSQLDLAFNPESGFNGWAVQYINLNMFFATGDAILLKVKYTGTGGSATLYFRINEEDTDWWQFKAPFTYFDTGLDSDGFKQLIIPLKSFQRMPDGMTGDGAKQFSFVKKFSIGISNNYSAGTLSLKDLEIGVLDDIYGVDKDHPDERKLIVGMDGCIEDFNDYDIYTQIYRYWDQSVENKDEAMKLDTTHKAGGFTNNSCAEFDYKADMEAATYQVYMNTKECVGKNALSLWLKDMSPKPTASVLEYLTYEDVAAEMTIQLTLDTGEWYRYVIPKLEKEWTNYTILFSSFELFNKVPGEPNEISSDHIMHMGFAFSYRFYRQGGDGKPDKEKPYPTYAIANPVYVDEIYLTSASETGQSEVPGTLKPDPDDATKVVIDTFEGYALDEELFGYWSYGNNHPQRSISLSTDVSSQGGSKSINMQYKSYDSVSYVRNTSLAHTVQLKGLAFDLKSDGIATIYINLNFMVNGSQQKLRYTLKGASTSWTHYEIGFHHFIEINGKTTKIYASTSKDIESISFGIVNNNYSQSNIYFDNLYFSNAFDYLNDITPTPIV